MLFPKESGQNESCLPTDLRLTLSPFIGRPSGVIPALCSSSCHPPERPQNIREHPKILGLFVSEPDILLPFPSSAPFPPSKNVAVGGFLPCSLPHVSFPSVAFSADHLRAHPVRRSRDGFNPGPRHADGLDTFAGPKISKLHISSRISQNIGTWGREATTKTPSDEAAS